MLQPFFTIVLGVKTVGLNVTNTITYITYSGKRFIVHAHEKEPFKMI
jgi:hypothetical protein